MEDVSHTHKTLNSNSLVQHSYIVIHVHHIFIRLFAYSLCQILASSCKEAELSFFHNEEWVKGVSCLLKNRNI